MHRVDKLIRSKRKTLTLEISSSAELIVRAPLRMLNEEIFNFVELKETWILRKKEAMINRIAQRRVKKFVDDEEYLFLGKAYPLVITEEKEIKLSDYLHFPRRYLDSPKEHLIKWYKQEALTVLTRRSEYFAEVPGLKYRSVKVTGAKKRLGSCGPNGNINYSWRLIVTPQSVIDYVVVHELCHLEIKNHSQRFWNKVKTILPDYKEQRRWLRKNRAALDI